MPVFDVCVVLVVGSVPVVGDVVDGSVPAPVSPSSPAGQAVSARPSNTDDTTGADVVRCSVPQCGHRDSCGMMCNRHDEHETNRPMHRG
jgi:hypothetical protein